MLRAFRNLPIIDSICRDIGEVALEPWFFNYTNPASAIAAVLRDAPDVRFSPRSARGTAPAATRFGSAELAGVDPGGVTPVRWAASTTARA